MKSGPGATCAGAALLRYEKAESILFRENDLFSREILVFCSLVVS